MNLNDETHGDEITSAPIIDTVGDEEPVDPSEDEDEDPSKDEDEENEEDEDEEDEDEEDEE